MTESLRGKKAAKFEYNVHLCLLVINMVSSVQEFSMLACRGGQVVTGVKLLPVMWVCLYIPCHIH